MDTTPTFKSFLIADLKAKKIGVIECQDIKIVKPDWWNADPTVDYHLEIKFKSPKDEFAYNLLGGPKYLHRLLQDYVKVRINDK